MGQQTWLFVLSLRQWFARIGDVLHLRRQESADERSNETGRYIHGSDRAQRLAYDWDGNMTATGRVDYCVYDAENRLTWAQTAIPAYTAGVPTNGWRYTYDYLSRRASKTTYTWNWTTSAWVFSSEQRFIY